MDGIIRYKIISWGKHGFSSTNHENGLQCRFNLLKHAWSSSSDFTTSKLSSTSPFKKQKTSKLLESPSCPRRGRSQTYKIKRHQSQLLTRYEFKFFQAWHSLSYVKLIKTKQFKEEKKIFGYDFYWWDEKKKITFHTGQQGRLATLKKNWIIDYCLYLNLYLIFWVLFIVDFLKTGTPYININKWKSRKRMNGIRKIKI